MPVYNIKVGGKNFKIEVSKISEDTFTVKVGDKVHEVKLESCLLYTSDAADE